MTRLVLCKDFRRQGCALCKGVKHKKEREKNVKCNEFRIRSVRHLLARKLKTKHSFSIIVTVSEYVS